MIGTSQASMQALMNEKFLPYDTPETYERRIRPYTYSILDANCLPILYNHLPETLELRVRLTAPANKDAFFVNLKNCWLESAGHRAIQNIPNILRSNESSTLPQQSLPFQNNYNTLQQDLIREQRRHNDTIAERDLITIAYNNEVNERNVY